MWILRPSLSHLRCSADEPVHQHIELEREDLFQGANIQLLRCPGQDQVGVPDGRQQACQTERVPHQDHPRH